MKKETNEKFEKELKSIKTIFKKYCGAKEISFDKKDNLLMFPLGLIVYIAEDDLWCIDVDLAMISDPLDIILLMQVIKDITQTRIDINIGMGYHSISCKKDRHAGLVFQDDVYALSRKLGIDNADAYETLAEEAREHYCEQCEELACDSKKILGTVQ